METARSITSHFSSLGRKTCFRWACGKWTRAPTSTSSTIHRRSGFSKIGLNPVHPPLPLFGRLAGSRPTQVSWISRSPFNGFLHFKRKDAAGDFSWLGRISHTQTRPPDPPLTGAGPESLWSGPRGFERDQSSWFHGASGSKQWLLGRFPAWTESPNSAAPGVGDPSATGDSIAQIAAQRGRRNVQTDLSGETQLQANDRGTAG